MTILKERLTNNKSLNSESRLQPVSKSSHNAGRNMNPCTPLVASYIFSDFNKKNKAVKPSKSLLASSSKPNSKVKTTNDAEQYLLDEIKSEQLDREQFLSYAYDMEQARTCLMQLLVDKPQTLLIFAKEYLFRIEQGYDQSELFSLSYDKYNQKPIQDNLSLQVNAKQFGIELYNLMQKIMLTACSENILYSDYSNQLSKIHFLPIFLQHISAKTIKSKRLKEDDKNRINKQLLTMLESRQVLINSNVRMVAFIVNKYAHSKIAFSDLMQEGTIGLIKAVDRFDYQRPVRFSTYAVFWIRQMISRAITKQKKLVSLPFNLACKVSIVFSSVNTFLQENNKWPSSKQLAESCQLSVKEIEAILESYKPCLSLSSHINDDDDLPVLLDTLEQQHFDSPLNELTSNNLNITLKHAIDCLLEREAFVIRNRFGINNGIELTLQEIADQFDVSKERIRQIQNAALSKLKDQFGTQLSDFLINDPA
jgi:RNA polymerase primary sigma factor